MSLFQNMGNRPYPRTLKEARAKGYDTLPEQVSNREDNDLAEEILEQEENDHTVEGASRRAAVLADEASNQDGSASAPAEGDSDGSAVVPDGSGDSAPTAPNNARRVGRPFTKGDSRINRAGRSPGRTMRQMIRALAEESKQAIITRLVSRATHGDVRAAEILLKYADAPWVADVTTTAFTLRIASPREDDLPLEQVEGELVDEERQALPPG